MRHSVFFMYCLQLSPSSGASSSLAGLSGPLRGVAVMVENTDSDFLAPECSVLLETPVLWQAGGLWVGVPAKN